MRLKDSSIAARLQARRSSNAAVPKSRARVPDQIFHPFQQFQKAASKPKTRRAVQNLALALCFQPLSPSLALFQ